MTLSLGRRPPTAPPGEAPYPHGEDERSHEATEGPRGIGGNGVFRMGGCGRPAGGRGLRGLGAAGTKVFLLPGFWSPVGSPEATLLLENVGTPAGQNEDSPHQALVSKETINRVKTHGRTLLLWFKGTRGPKDTVAAPKFKADKKWDNNYHTRKK